jgi:hypothetical protein
MIRTRSIDCPGKELVSLGSSAFGPRAKRVSLAHSPTSPRATRERRAMAS